MRTDCEVGSIFLKENERERDQFIIKVFLPYKYSFADSVYSCFDFAIITVFFILSKFVLNFHTSQRFSKLNRALEFTISTSS